jgi:hypothetical protein
MRIIEAPPAGVSPRNTQAKSSHKRTLIVLATLLLATASTVANAPGAAATPASLNSYLSYDCKTSHTLRYCRFPLKPGHVERPSWPCDDHPGIDCDGNDRR